MGDKLEVFYNENIDDDSNPFLGRSFSMDSKYSENTKFIMDNETLSLVVEAYNEAKTILTNYKDILIEMSELLKNQTTLNRDDVYGHFKHKLVGFYTSDINDTNKV
jgi:ATP-dependent Zn protease